jgi:hypothetical protein
MRDPVAAAIAISIGLVILIGYFVPMPLLSALQSTLLGWAVIIGAFAGLVGILNLVFSHWNKLTSKTNRDIYSAFTLVGFVLAVGVGLWFGPGDPLVQRGIEAIIVPVETSLMAALAVALAYACLRLLHRRLDGLTIVFVISTIVFLLLGGGLLAGIDLPLVRDFTLFIDRLPVAGARGILLGIALGGLTAGLRILTGADRPYSG